MLPFQTVIAAAACLIASVHSHPWIYSGCQLDTQACDDGTGCSEIASDTKDNVLLCDAACSSTDSSCNFFVWQQSIMTCKQYTTTARYSELSTATNMNDYISGWKGCTSRGSDIPGQWGDWSSSGCTTTCGAGETTYARTCTNPAPQLNGAACATDIAEATKTDAATACTVVECPIDFSWGAWGTWGACTGVCGGNDGVMARQRNCVPPQHGGVICPSDNDVGTQTCTNSNPCGNVAGNWGEWGDYGACSLECGGGQWQRGRNCDNPRQEGNGADCVGDATEVDDCNVGVCTVDVDGMWGPWGEGPCTEDDCQGEMAKARACNSPPPALGGDPCDGSDGVTTDEIVDCNVDLGVCPTALTISINIGVTFNASFADKTSTVYEAFDLTELYTTEIEKTGHTVRDMDLTLTDANAAGTTFTFDVRVENHNTTDAVYDETKLNTDWTATLAIIQGGRRRNQIMGSLEGLATSRFGGFPGGVNIGAATISVPAAKTAAPATAPPAALPDFGDITAPAPPAPTPAPTTDDGATPASSETRTGNACQSLVASDSGFGSIRSSHKTKYWDNKISCDWVIVGKPSTTLGLSFRNNELLNSEERLTCDGCGGACCNNVEIKDGGVTTRYCCGVNMPSAMSTASNAVIVRLNLHEDSLSTRGFHLDWHEEQ